MNFFNIFKDSSFSLYPFTLLHVKNCETPIRALANEGMWGFDLNSRGGSLKATIFDDDSFKS